MQVKAKFRVLSIAPRQDGLCRKRGVGVKKKVTQTTAVGVATKPKVCWDLPGTQVGKAPSWLSPAEVLGLTQF